MPVELISLPFHLPRQDKKGVRVSMEVGVVSEVRGRVEQMLQELPYEWVAHCEHRVLLEAVELVERVARSHSMPILNGVKLEPRGETLVLAATDLETGIEIVVPATIVPARESYHPCVVAAKNLKKVLAATKADSEHVVLCSRRTAMELCTGEMTYELNGLDPDDLPLLPEMPLERVEIKDLDREILRKLSELSPEKADSEAIKSVLWRFSEDGLKLYATNGYVLARVQVSGTFPRQDLFVSGKSMRHIVRAMPKDGTVCVACDQQYAHFSWGNVRYICRLVTPERELEYEEVFPTAVSVEVQIAAQELLRAIKAATVVQDEDTEAIWLTVYDPNVSEKYMVDENACKLEDLQVEPSRMMVRVSASSEFFGKFKTEVKPSRMVLHKATAAPYPVPFVAVVRSSYLQEVINILGGNEIILRMVTSKTPIVAVSPDAPHVAVVFAPIDMDR